MEDIRAYVGLYRAMEKQREVTQLHFTSSHLPDNSESNGTKSGHETETTNHGDSIG